MIVRNRIGRLLSNPKTIVGWKWLDEQRANLAVSLSDRFEDRDTTRNDPEARCLRTLQMVDHMIIPRKGDTHVKVQHCHPNAEETFFILRGKGIFQVGDEKQDVGVGDVIYIPPNTMHLLINSTDKPLEFIDWAVPVGDALRDLIENQENSL